MELFDIYKEGLTINDIKKPELHSSFTPVGVKYHQMVFGEPTVYVLDKYIEGTPSNIMYSIPYHVINNVWRALYPEKHKTMTEKLCNLKIIVIDYATGSIHAKKLKQGDTNVYINEAIIQDIKTHEESISQNNDVISF